MEEWDPYGRNKKLFLNTSSCFDKIKWETEEEREKAWKSVEHYVKRVGVSAFKEKKISKITRKITTKIPKERMISRQVFVELAGDGSRGYSVGPEDITRKKKEIMERQNNDK